MKTRLFAGIYPCGIVYADKGREIGGDYAKLAFLPFGKLVLDVEKNCPAIMREIIEKDSAKIIAKKGKHYQISTSGQTVLLGA